MNISQLVVGKLIDTHSTVLRSHVVLCSTSGIPLTNESKQVAHVRSSSGYNSMEAAERKNKIEK